MDRGLGVYGSLFEDTGDMQLMYRRVLSITEVLVAQNFKPKGIQASVNGIEKIVLTDGTVVLPENGGFTDKDISGVVGIIANGGSIVLNHKSPSKWYTISDHYKRDVSPVLIADVVLNGTLNNRGLPSDSEISVLVDTEKTSPYKPTTDFEHEIDELRQELNKIKWSSVRRWLASLGESLKYYLLAYQAKTR